MIAKHLATTALCLVLAGVSLHAQLPKHHEVLGGGAGDEFGHGASGIGDVNGDGRPDFAVGGRFADFAGVDSGRVDVFSGKNGALLYSVDGDLPGDTLGFVVADLGDIDLDGVPDWAAGAPRADVGGLINNGSVKVISGGTGALIHLLAGAASGDEFGSGVAGVGDINNDGYPDVIVGAIFADGLTSFSGEARVFSGADGSLLHVIPGLEFGSGFGFNVAGLDDLNADGVPDIGIGVPVASPGGVTGAGEIRIYSGFDGTLIRTHAGPNAGDQFGRSIANAGDLDGDGTDDIVVGAMKADPGGDSSGLIRAISGISGATLFTRGGDAISDQLGWSVDAAGDVNGDGQLDVVAGARFADAAFGDEGYLRVFSGSDGSTLATYFGAAAGDNLGWSVSGIGDVNGDGLDDVLGGARYSDIAGLDAGSGMVFAVGGARAYGDDPLGSQLIDLEWGAGISGQPSQGGAIISGANPFANGIAALSEFPNQFITSGIELLIDITPGNFISGNFGYNAAGDFFIPINLRQPVLAGETYYLQAFAADVSQSFGISSSNGLELLFTL
jgi:FG-GAP repeat protein